MRFALRPPSRWLQIALAAWLIAIVAVALLRPLPWHRRDAPGEFSVVRAVEHLQWIAREVHPVGTRAHADVALRLEREFRQIGLSVETQDGSWLETRGPTSYRVVQVRNVIARLPGTGSTGSVLLMAHYDSATHAPGAADDGVGIAVLLETARLLRADRPLRNDVIFAATDAEEPGLFGAHVFLAQHPWAHGVGAILNFEARGVSGPSVMFETGEQDGWLVREFASAVPAPFASSLAPSIYARMGNATDLTVLRGTGMPRLNFGFVEGWQSYHTERDTPDRVNRESIWEHGSSAIALARRLGQIDLRHADQDTSRLIYFNLGPFIARYDERAAMPFAVMALAVWGWLAVSRLRVGALRWRDAIGGLVAAPLVIVAVTMLARAVWRLVLAFDPNQRALFDRSWIHVGAFVVLTIGVMLLVHRLWRRIASPDGLLLGALFWIGVAGLCAAVWLPGASHVFEWPLVAAALAAWGCRGVSQTDSHADAQDDDGPTRTYRARHLLAIACGSAIALCIFVPTIWMMYVAMPVAPFVFVPMLALTVLLLGPCIELIAARASWAWPAGACAVAVAVLGVAVLIANRTPIEPHADYRPSRSAPVLSVESDVLQGDTRILAFRLTANPEATEAAACLRSTQGIMRASSGQHPLALATRTPTSASTPAASCELVIGSLAGDAAGLPITVELPAGASLDVETAEHAYDDDGVTPWLVEPRSSSTATAVAAVPTRRFRWSPSAHLQNEAGSP